MKRLEYEATIHKRVQNNKAICNYIETLTTVLTECMIHIMQYMYRCKHSQYTHSDTKSSFSDVSL